MNAAVEKVLPRLASYREIAPGQWRGKLPSHEGRRDHLAVRETDDGTVLLHDFAGRTLEEVLAELDLEARDLYPERRAHISAPGKYRPPMPSARELLALMEFDLAVFEIALAAWVGGKRFEEYSSEDRQTIQDTLASMRRTLDACTG